MNLGSLVTIDGLWGPGSSRSVRVGRVGRVRRVAVGSLPLVFCTV